MPKLKSKQGNQIESIETKEQNECKLMPCSLFMKLRGTDKVYQEGLEAASKFNKRLFLDRKTRIPFIDSQTRVAQSNSLLWYFDYQREDGIKSNEQIFSYPLKLWIKKRRLHYDLDSTMLRNHQFDVNQLNNENSNSTDSMNHHHHHLKYISNETDDHNMGTKSTTTTTTPIVNNEEWHSQQQQEDSFDYYNDDNESDFDDYEDKRKKSKRGRGAGKGRRSEIHVDDKPFECEKCGAKYKTKPGLNYHVQNAHNNKTNRSNPIHADRSSHRHHESYINDENTNSTAYDESSHHHEPSVKTQSKLCASCGYGSIVDDPKRQVDLLISCSECPRYFHPICLNFTANMISSVKKYKWQCIECKKCVICGNSENDDKLLFCDDCDRGYHMYCLSPPINEAPEGDWNCELCIKEFGNNQ
jgi:zinc finger protein ubi-d4